MDRASLLELPFAIGLIVLFTWIGSFVFDPATGVMFGSCYGNKTCDNGSICYVPKNKCVPDPNAGGGMP